MSSSCTPPTCASAIRSDRHLASCLPHISEEEIKERQKHVIATIRTSVMAHVISTREPETGREPPVHVNTPVDLLSRNQINSPANEHARKNSRQSEQGSNQKCRNSVYYEQKNNVHRGADEGYMLCLRGRTNLSMVRAMFCPQGAARLVQQPSMIEVFESVPPDQTDDQTN